MQKDRMNVKFVKPNSISAYLKCPICMDVFWEAKRLYCGHTFCQICLNDYLKIGNTCPQCRTKVVVKNIGIDLLAREIINQFEVFCSCQDCPWKGSLQNMMEHIQKCAFVVQPEKMEKVGKNYKIQWHETLDDEIQDKINENTIKGSLQARIMVKTDSLTIPISQNTPNTQPKLKKDKKQKISANIQYQPKQSVPNKNTTYDFVSSLFQ